MVQNVLKKFVIRRSLLVQPSRNSVSEELGFSWSHNVSRHWQNCRSRFFSNQQCSLFIALIVPSHSIKRILIKLMIKKPYKKLPEKLLFSLTKALCFKIEASCKLLFK